MPTEPCDCLAHNPVTGNFVPPLRRLANDICTKHGLTLAQLRGNCRLPQLVAARFEFYYHAIQLGRSTPQIGRFIGKDHTTVLYGAVRYSIYHQLPLPGRISIPRRSTRYARTYPAAAPRSQRLMRRRLTKDGVMLPPYRITPEEMERLRR